MASKVDKLTEANTSFALDMYKELSEAKAGGNVFFSPISISTALAMTYLGAKENTAKEMKDTLKFADMEDMELHGAFADFNGALNKADVAYTLRVANRIFARKNYKFLDEFLSATRKHYLAEASLMDFVNDPSGSTKEINEWVEEQTAKKIQNLIPDGVIDAQTAMVLVNAIYFKGSWKDKFKSEKTHKREFKVNKDSLIETDFMFMSQDFRAGHDRELDCKVLELPYVNNDLSMIIILPNKDDGLAALEAKMDVAAMDRLTKSIYKIKCKVYLPKFKLTCDFSLNEMLTKLGMKELFTAGVANLSGMDGTRDLFVSQVIHKAFIEVNEEGSEAAAATAVMISLMCMPEILQFQADHPFLFMIKDNRSQAILFMGKYTSPPQD